MVSEDHWRQPIFVDRARELGALNAQLDAALAGHGSAVLLAGEPGIGKTRVLQEFAASAQARGATVVWGHAFESAWTPPYGAWAEALGGYAATIGVERLQEALGADAPLLGPLVPAGHGPVSPTGRSGPAVGAALR